MYTEKEPPQPQVRFEFDEAKSRANRLKRGIDFVEAQRLWADERLGVVDVRVQDEARLTLIGMIDGRHWAAVITHRGAAVRIISVRRARPKEVRNYGGEEDHGV